MADERELIMQRILALLALPGAETVARNLDEIADVKTPSVVLFDADEVAFDNPRATSGKPTIVHARPQIEIDLGEVPENVGTVANEWLTNVKRAILLDDALQIMCGDFSDAGAHYEGATTSLTPGRSTEVSLVVTFTISYHLKPYDL